MKTFSFYDPVSGLFEPRHLTCTNPLDLDRNAPAGKVPIVGRFDHRLHQVDVTTGKVVDREASPDAGALRARRDALLLASDRMMLPDAPLTPEQVAAWKTYRAALRALPAQPGFPQTVTWPVPPV